MNHSQQLLNHNADMFAMHQLFYSNACDTNFGHHMEVLSHAILMHDTLGLLVFNAIITYDVSNFWKLKGVCLTISRSEEIILNNPSQFSIF